MDCTQIARPRSFLSKRLVGNVVVVGFPTGKIQDEANILSLRSELKHLIAVGKAIVLNLTDVEYLSSAALPMLTEMQNRVTRARGTLRLCCLGQVVAEVLRISKLDEKFQIYTDEPAALEGLLKAEG